MQRDRNPKEGRPIKTVYVIPQTTLAYINKATYKSNHDHSIYRIEMLLTTTAKLQENPTSIMTDTNMKAALVSVTNTVLDSFHKFSENLGSRNSFILSKYHLNFFEIHVLDYFMQKLPQVLAF